MQMRFSQNRRCWVSLLCTSLLIACASPSGTQIKEDGGWKYFAAEEETALQDLSIRIRQLCQQPKNGVDKDTCVRKNLVPNFDISGIGQEKCQGQGDAWKTLECVVKVSMLVTLRDALDDKSFPSMADGGWRESSDYKNKLFVALNTQIADKCGHTTTGSAPLLNDCSRTEILHALRLSRQSADRCMSLAIGKEFSSCVSEAYAVAVLREGVSRLSAISI